MDPRTSTYTLSSTHTQTAAHPNKQYPTPPPPMSPRESVAASDPSSPPPAYAHSQPRAASATMGLGLSIPEKHWTGVSLYSPRQTPVSALPNDSPVGPPSSSHTKDELRSLAISRTRFVLRLISTIFSMVIVGMMSDAYAGFWATKGHRLMYAGEPIWPDAIDLTASNAMFAIGAVTATFSLSVLVTGMWWPRVRHATPLGDMVALTVAAVNFALGIGGAMFFWMYRGDAEGLWTWTCEHKLVEHPQVEFGTVCAAMQFSFAMGWAIAAAEALVVLNVMAGCFLLGRAGGGAKRGHLGRMGSSRI